MNIAAMITPRMMIRLIVLAALGVLITWIARHTYWERVTLPVEFSGPAATNQWYVAEQLAGKLSLDSQHLASTEDLPTATHHVLYLHDWNWGVLPERTARLQQWVRQGGRLVIDKSVYGYDQELVEWLGVSTVDVKQAEEQNSNEDDADNDDETPVDALSGLLNTPCAEFQLSGEATALVDSPGYHFCGFDALSTLHSTGASAWSASNRVGIQVLRLSVGAGSVTLINGEPFTNRLMLRADNALLFAAAGQLHADDHIAWLTEPESASLLALVWRHGAPVVIAALLGVLLWLWRQGTRFGPLSATPSAARRSLKEQIRGTSAFLLRSGEGHVLHQACVNALQRTAQQHIAHYARMDSEQRLIALAKHGEVAMDDLRAALYLQGTRQQAALSRGIVMLETVRRRIAGQKTRSSP